MEGWSLPFVGNLAPMLPESIGSIDCLKLIAKFYRVSTRRGSTPYKLI